VADLDEVNQNGAPAGEIAAGGWWFERVLTCLSQLTGLAADKSF
jgi:hypothetical protein